MSNPHQVVQPVLYGASAFSYLALIGLAITYQDIDPVPLPPILAQGNPNAQRQAPQGPGGGIKPRGLPHIGMPLQSAVKGS